MPLTNEELLKENKVLKRKIKFLEQSVTQAGTIKSNYDELIKKLEQRDKRLEEMNSKLEILVHQRTKELEEINHQLKSLSVTDSLTGLKNRRSFDEVFENEYNRAKRQGYSFSLLILDIDFFKQFNDIYGHHKGDEALKEVAGVLKCYERRAEDFAFRYGGEEFTYISSFQKEEDLAKVADMIREDIFKVEIPHRSNIYKFVTISIGGGIVVSHNRISKAKAFEIADENLYKAKNGGRNRICISSI